jgi:hypothetical protein
MAAAGAMGVGAMGRRAGWHRRVGNATRASEAEVAQSIGGNE